MPNLFFSGFDSSTQTLTNKSIDADSNTITNIEDADIKTHTTTKISTTSKSLLNTAIMYEDEDNAIGAHYFEFNEIASPSNPAADKLRLYMDSTDEKLKTRKSSGTVVDLETQGETTTASNVNVGGVGVFKQKTGVDLEFRGINAGSNKITITNDSANNEIDIDVAEANLTLGNLSGTLAISKGGTGQTTMTAAFDALAPTTTQADIIYYNGTDNVRLPKGTASQFLKMNSGATAPEWVTTTGGGSIALLNKTSTTNTIVNTTTETSLYSVTVPANNLSSHGMVRVNIAARIKNNSGSAATYQLIVKYGTTVMYQDTSASLAASASERDHIIQLNIFPNNNSSSAQFLHGTAYFTGSADLVATVGNGDFSTLMGSAGGVYVLLSGTASETTTTDKTLDIRIILSAANANFEIKRYFGMAEYIA